MIHSLLWSSISAAAEASLSHCCNASMTVCRLSKPISINWRIWSSVGGVFTPKSAYNLLTWTNFSSDMVSEFSADCLHARLVEFRRTEITRWSSIMHRLQMLTWASTNKCTTQEPNPTAARACLKRHTMAHTISPSEVQKLPFLIKWLAETWKNSTIKKRRTSLKIEKDCFSNKQISAQIDMETLYK